MSDLWWGLLLSVPVGIGVNLLSGPISRSLSNRNKAAADKQSQQDSDFLERATAYAKNRTALYSFLLEALIRIAWIGAVFGLATGLLGVLGQAVGASANVIDSESFTAPRVLYTVSSGIFILSQLAALMGTILVLNIARNALSTVRKVRELANEL